MQLKSILQLTISVLCLSGMKGFYFYLEQGEELCFYGMAFKKSVTSVHYNFLDSMKNKKSGENIIVNMKIYEHQITPNEKGIAKGEFDFSSNVQGEIQLCFSTDSYHWVTENAKLRMELDYHIVFPEQENNEEDMKKFVTVEQLTPIYELNKDIDKQLRTLSGQNEGYTEAILGVMEESYITQNNIEKLTLCQIVVLLIVALIQVVYLKRFISSKKLF